MEEPIRGRRPPIEGDRIALCLSGGGYRAALFHLGAIRRLNELGLLSRLDAISSVSGGSILSAHLAAALRPWPAPGVVLDDAAFRSRVGEPFERFCATNIRTRPVLERAFVPWNWFRPDTAVRALAKTYAHHLNDLTLGDLNGHPRFVFCATDMLFGVNWVFDSADPRTPGTTRMGDYQVGYRVADDWKVADAVAASSCFPPVFNPLELHADPHAYARGRYDKPDRDRFVAGVSLSDGGVYDNLGSQPVMDRYGTVLVSDGGGVFEEIEPIGRFALIKRIRRYTAIAQRGGGAMRREVLIGSFEDGDRRGTYWGIGTPPSRYAARSDDVYPDALVDDVIEEVRTDLDAFSAAEQGVLQNHGYLQMDAAARTHLAQYAGLLPDPIPASAPPYPEWLDPDAVSRALASSNKRKLPFGRR